MHLTFQLSHLSLQFNFCRLCTRSIVRSLLSFAQVPLRLWTYVRRFLASRTNCVGRISDGVLILDYILHRQMTSLDYGFGFTEWIERCPIRYFTYGTNRYFVPSRLSPVANLLPIAWKLWKGWTGWTLFTLFLSPGGHNGHYRQDGHFCDQLRISRLWVRVPPGAPLIQACLV